MIFKRLKKQHLLEEIYGDIITLDDALEKQIKLIDEIDRFKKSTRLKVLEKKEQKYWLLIMQLDFLKENKKFIMVLKAKYFQ